MTPVPLYKQQQVAIYNSLNGAKEPFTSIVPGAIGMYVCGPTVYSNVHLGNCRTFISFDLIYRYLKHLGYKIRYVRNITDAGHLENDADEGEDKISKKARLEEIEPMEVVQRYTLDFHKILSQFNNLPPNIEPTATGHIVEQIEVIKTIIENGFAYEVNGSVYFDVVKFDKTNDYGKLSGRNLEDMINNSRELAGQSEKRNPQDFALWKKAESKHIMRWPSPWSDDFPGWHLECRAISTKYLGKEFDIHGGGLDLKFPNYECEIAQGEAASGKTPVRYWMRANMLTLNGKKMSKSTGNTLLPEELFSGNNNILNKAFKPSVVRFFMLQAHYRSILDFSNNALEASEKGFTKLIEAMQTLSGLSAEKTTEGFDILAWKQRCYDAMNDDFNSPILIAQLFEAVKYINQVKEGKASVSVSDLEELKESLDAFVFDILGLQSNNETANDVTDKLDGVIELLIELRKEARINKDFALSDKIRDELAEKGVQLKDGREGTTYVY